MIACDEFERARQWVLRLGWNSTCYQILNAGIEHWWTSDGHGLVGFVRSGRMLIVAGAPVCAPEYLRQTIEEWEVYAASAGFEICYFGAEGRMQNLLGLSSRHVSVVLGSQPEWSPRQFVDTHDHSRSLRAQTNRATNKGVTVREWTSEEAAGNRRLNAVHNEWLLSRGLPTMHFLVEPARLAYLNDRRIFVAEAADSVMGFVTLCPVPAQNGWLTEQFVRVQRAPNGTVELMLYESAKAVQNDGATYFTMGVVPLVALGSQDFVREPFWLPVARNWASAHFTRFYNFRGLFEFKSKFRPTKWQHVVVIVKDSQFRLRHLRSIARAFTRTAPKIALAQGLMKSIRPEWHWLWQN